MNINTNEIGSMVGELLAEAMERSSVKEVHRFSYDGKLCFPYNSVRYHSTADAEGKVYASCARDFDSIEKAKYWCAANSSVFIINDTVWLAFRGERRSIDDWNELLRKERER